MKVFILHGKSPPLLFQNIPFYFYLKLEFTSSNTIQCPAFNAASSGPSRQANSPPFPPSTGKSVPNKSVTSFGKREQGRGRVGLQNFAKVHKQPLLTLLHIFSLPFQYVHFPSI